MTDLDKDKNNILILTCIKGVSEIIESVLTRIELIEKRLGKLEGK